ncbi:MAG: hypothetical protein DRQ78_07110 [Epsilonproteobacteria bacterium]|nr:MAG: hypothetical protein DRQ78_07110 [Campylobacterota bacterium]
MKNVFKAIGILAFLLGLLGCGNNNDSDNITDLQKGYLIDSPVAGVNYECGSITGTTTSTGEFSCTELPVVFKIGEYELGTISAFTSDTKVYPQDLLGLGRDNFTDANLIALARLLQSLDDDGNISESITIPADVAALFDENSNALSLEELASLAGVTLVSEAEAIAHLQAELGTGSSLGENETAATIPVYAVGTYEYTFHESVTGSGITDGVVSTFIVASDGTLTIDGSIVLSNPVIYRENGHEAIWFDTTNGLGYSLSSLISGVHEINVGTNVHYDQAGFIFYGQYNAEETTIPEEEGFSLVGLYVGTYDLRVAQKGGLLSAMPDIDVPGSIETVTIDTNGSVYLSNLFSVSSAEQNVSIDDNRISVWPNIVIWIPEDGDTSGYVGGSDGLAVTLYLDTNNTLISMKFVKYTGFSSLYVLVESAVSEEEETFFTLVDTAILLNDANFTVVESTLPYLSICENFTMSSSRPSFTTYEAIVYALTSNDFAINDEYEKHLIALESNSSMVFDGHRYRLRDDGYLDIENYGGGYVMTSRATNNPSEIPAECAATPD